MKKICVLLFSICSALVLTAQSSQAQFDAIEKAIKNANTTELSSYFANTVECDLLGEEGTYSKTQATLVVKRFFEKQVPKNFSFKHSSDKQAVKYAIGTLQAENGNNIRITVFFKTENNAIKIQQLRAEKE